MNSEILDQLPPNSPDAEKGVLGSILLEPKRIDEVGTLLPEDFYADAHQRLFRHLRVMRDAGEKIDLTLLSERLKQAGDFEATGGIAYLAEVVHSVAVSCHARQYGEIVAAKARYRRLRTTAEFLWRDAQAATEEPEAILARVEAELLRFAPASMPASRLTWPEALIEANQRIDQFQDRSRHCGRLTGLADFDTLYGGFYPQELTILAARTGIGKTALAVQTAMRSAQRGRLVLFVSLEMSRAEIATRILCGQARVSNRDIRSGRLRNDDRRRSRRRHVSWHRPS